MDILFVILGTLILTVGVTHVIWMVVQLLRRK